MRPTLRLLALAACLAACDGGDPVDKAPSTDEALAGRAHGPTVRWDLGARPLPEVPLPNDVATFPDSSSPTGLRINAGLVSDTSFETLLREGFNSLDGWGTFMPLTVAFDDDLDLDSLTRRMRGDDHEFADDAVYLVNLRTGLPVPLDMGDGAFVYNARNRDGYYPNDPRGGESNLILDTVDEDTNRNGVLDPGEDTNFDGVLNRAAVFPAGARPEDALTTFWEPDSHTLILRPKLPLEERTRYAVVLTDRLTGRGGRPVRSPFPSVAHPTQADRLEVLDAQLRARPAYYGALAYRPTSADGAGVSRVTFAWSFTTQGNASDLRALREGLYGRGVFAPLARTEPRMEPAELARGTGCNAERRARPYVVRGEALMSMVTNLGMILGLDEERRNRLVETYRYVDYVVFGTYRTPYLMGDPRSTDPFARWSINPRTGDLGTVGVDEVQFGLVVPKALGGRRAPFPVALYGHGYTGNFLDTLATGASIASHGIAALGINASGHGLTVTQGERVLVNALLSSLCAQGAMEPLLTNRARDLNGDDIPDSGGDFWTSYVFHTRDQVRQSALDHMQLIRAMRGFDGRARGAGDYNGDGGANDLAGDFDGDGVVDIGGPDNGYYITGGSLGGILSMVVAGADPAVRASAPVAGGGGLTDIGLRSTQGGIKEAVILRVMGPLVMSIPASDYPPDSRGRRRTSCSTGQTSLRFVIPDVNNTGELEFACADVSAGTPGSVSPVPALAPGDDVTVTNTRNHVTRCARVAADGRLRVGVPTNADDPLIVTVYRGAGVTDYGTCAPRPGADVKSYVDTWQVVEGDCDVHCGHVPPDARPDSPARRWATRGARLTSPADGMGIRRQTPNLRRFLLLAQAALDGGDPINYAREYFIRPSDNGAPRALLVINTIGDQAVPISTGNAFARAAGLIPFFRPDAASRYPDFAEYVTPQGLFDRYGRTPDRLLAARGVYEGLSIYNRFPAANGRQDALFDVDDLDEGAQGFTEQAESQPLRLVRYARAIDSAAAVNDVWAPTLAGYTPSAAPMGAVLNAYIRPEGVHGFGLPEPSLPWDPGVYLVNLVGRFFSSDGADLPYRSTPATHQCLARSDCDFIPRPPTSP